MRKASCIKEIDLVEPVKFSAIQTNAMKPVPSYDLISHSTSAGVASHDDMKLIDSECNITTQYSRLEYIVDKIDSDQYTILHCMQNHRHSRLCSEVVHHRVRDREPSRVPLRKVINLLKYRKLRKNCRKMIKKSVPVSSVLYSIATNYKRWKIKCFKRQDSFYSGYIKPTKKSTLKHDIYRQNVLFSGDIKLNPGPRTVCNAAGKRIIPFDGSNFIFRYRLLRHNLRPLDVGGGGDCLYRSVSHQLYGNEGHHLDIRAEGVKYLREHPERFIESVVNTPWAQYLSDMSVQGTWADHFIIIQAVADALNLRINIIESDENFTEITLVEPANAIANPRSIYIYVGHIGHLHYVSTCLGIPERSSNGLSNSSNDFHEFENSSNTESSINTQEIDVDSVCDIEHQRNSADSS